MVVCVGHEKNPKSLKRYRAKNDEVKNIQVGLHRNRTFIKRSEKLC